MAIINACTLLLTVIVASSTICQSSKSTQKTAKPKWPVFIWLGFCYFVLVLCNVSCYCSNVNIQAVKCNNILLHWYAIDCIYLIAQLRSMHVIYSNTTLQCIINCGTLGRTLKDCYQKAQIQIR